MIRAGRLVLVRHGESIWNITDKAAGRTTRFTGWADIPLSNTGVLQSIASGKALNALGMSCWFGLGCCAIMSCHVTQRASIVYNDML
jgi:bisphosphoglycerate-dependent phosphoglycerate mutase